MKMLTAAANKHQGFEVTYFAGSITHPFPETESNSDRYIYGLYDSYIKYKRLSLNTYNNLLISYLTEKFILDTELLNPQELVEKYGTHILLSLYTGAKLSIDYQGEYIGEHRNGASENSFRIGLSEIFGLPTGLLTPVDSATLKDVTNPKIAFEAIGGDPSKIQIDQTSKNAKVKTAAWRESITEENARFVYLDGLDKLLPISDLIANEEKKQEVKNYIHEYIKVNEVKVD